MADDYEMTTHGMHLAEDHGIRVVGLDDGHGERPERLVAGRAAVIPAGSWHRIAIREPATLLFVTPVPASTEHRAFRAG